jgi:hypothetical protein
MKKFGFVGIAIAALAVSGCGGGSSSPAPAPAAATPTPTPAPPGPVSLTYTSTFGAAGTAPAPLAFQAPTQTASLTATETGYTGSFTAASSCAQVTVTPASSATGAFTATAADAATTGCTITVTGAATGTPATLAATVLKPAGVVLRWYTPNYLTQSPPIPISSGPINLIGLGTLFASILQISEQNYVSGFAAANVVTTGCAGFATIAPVATPTGLPTTAPGSSMTYYTVTGVNAVTTASGCFVGASDSYVPLAPGTPNPQATIGVSITTSTGTFQ